MMAVIVMTSAKASPGVTTSLALLGAVWPTPVVLADCDPSGGDLTSGWLGRWMVDGEIRADVGVLSFATATRHMNAVDHLVLAEHLQDVPGLPHAAVLGGLAHSSQAGAVGVSSWQRLANALRAVTCDVDEPRDVLVDLGRLGPTTPWPLLHAADLVLVTVRPRQRDLYAAGPAIESLRDQLSGSKLALAICATDTGGARQAAKVLGLAALLALPHAPREAQVFSDGAEIAQSRRSRLVRTARRHVRELRSALETRSDEQSTDTARASQTRSADSIVGATP